MKLTDHPVAQRWTPKREGVIQLYSLPTPNGIKASAILEESGLEYDAHLVRFAVQEQKTPEFLALNPNGKIPAILDPKGPGNKPLGLWESGAIMLYVAEKAGVLLPEDPAKRYEIIQWVFFQVGGVGPMFGQFGHFHKFAGDSAKHEYALGRYSEESRRLLHVMETHLTGREYFVGDSYTIADLSMWPWVRTLHKFYEATDVLELADFPRVNDWLGRCQARPASIAAVGIPAQRP